MVEVGRERAVRRQAGDEHLLKTAVRTTLEHVVSERVHGLAVEHAGYRLVVLGLRQRHALPAPVDVRELQASDVDPAEARAIGEQDDRQVALAHGASSVYGRDDAPDLRLGERGDDDPLAVLELQGRVVAPDASAVPLEPSGRKLDAPENMTPGRPGRRGRPAIQGA